MSEKLVHYVSDAPFDPNAIEMLTPEQEQVYMASRWLMMWLCESMIMRDMIIFS